MLGQWLPIDRTILEMVVRHIPAPNVISSERAQRLLYPENVPLNTYPSQTLALQQDFKLCSDKSENIIVFVSKMTPVHISQLPQNKPKRLTETELQSRRDEVRKRIEERKQAAAQNEMDTLNEGMSQLSTKTTELEAAAQTAEDTTSVEKEQNDFEFIAFARIFSGTLKPGMKLYNLAPKHDPRNVE